MVLTWLSKYRDFGLLLLRLGIGGMMIMHGWPKLTGGVETWTKLGGAMSHLGITFLPAFWGFMAAASESVGGALLILGFLFRPATGLLFFTMLVAAFMKYRVSGGAFLEWAWPAELGIVFLSLFFIGAGRFSLDKS
jgi:putative oxidoreductase